MTTGEIVRARRLSLGLTQKVVAQRAGITTKTVYHVELNRGPGPETLAKLASALQCQPSDLIGVPIDPDAKLNSQAHSRLKAILSGPYAPLARAVIDDLYNGLTLT